VLPIVCRLSPTSTLRIQWLQALGGGNHADIYDARQLLLAAAESNESPVQSDPSAAVDTRNMRLDVFLAQHTSEDNAAFEELLGDAHADARSRNWWLYQRHDVGPHAAALSDNAEAVRALLKDRAAAATSAPTGSTAVVPLNSQHAGLSAGEGINHWAHRPRNQLFFTPDLAVSNHISGVQGGTAVARDAALPAPCTHPAPADSTQLAQQGSAGTSLAPPPPPGANGSCTLPCAGAAMNALPSHDSGMAVLAPTVRLNAAGGRVQPRRLIHASTRLTSAEAADVLLSQQLGGGGGGSTAASDKADRVKSMLAAKAKVNGFAYLSTPSPMPGGGRRGARHPQHDVGHSGIYPPANGSRRRRGRRGDPPHS
jgi:hypothetical protein